MKIINKTKVVVDRTRNCIKSLAFFLFGMKCVYSICLVILVLITKTYSVRTGDDEVLSRHKRYLAFPEGSTFVVILCETVATIMPFEIFYEGINWGVAYDLPNVTTAQGYAKNKHEKRRRHRRDLYTRFESLMNSIGYDGRSCIYRALCEAPRRFNQKSNTLSEELLRLFFKFPLQRLSDEEPKEHGLYQRAYRRGRRNTQQRCSEMFPGCPISLIDLALGYYNGYEET